MSKANNIVSLTGRLGQDPEIKVTPSGTKLARVSLATQEYNPKTKKREGVWHSATAFGHAAEYLERFAAKGRMVELVGCLAYNEWTDKNGNKKKDAYIVVDDCILLDADPNKGASSNNPGAGARSENHQAPSGPEPTPGGFDDDIPW